MNTNPNPNSALHHSNTNAACFKTRAIEEALHRFLSGNISLINDPETSAPNKENPGSCASRPTATFNSQYQQPSSESNNSSEFVSCFKEEVKSFIKKELKKQINAATTALEARITENVTSAVKAGINNQPSVNQAQTCKNPLMEDIICIEFPKSQITIEEKEESVSNVEDHQSIQCQSTESVHAQNPERYLNVKKAPGFISTLVNEETPSKEEDGQSNYMNSLEEQTLGFHPIVKAQTSRKNLREGIFEETIFSDAKSQSNSCSSSSLSEDLDDEDELDEDEEDEMDYDEILEKLQELILADGDTILNHTWLATENQWNNKLSRLGSEVLEYLTELMDHFSNLEDSSQCLDIPYNDYIHIDFKSVKAGDSKAIEDLVKEMSYGFLDKAYDDVYHWQYDFIKNYVEATLEILEQELVANSLKNKSGRKLTTVEKYLSELIEEGYYEYAEKAYQWVIDDLANDHTDSKALEREFENCVRTVINAYVQGIKDAREAYISEKEESGNEVSSSYNLGYDMDSYEGFNPEEQRLIDYDFIDEHPIETPSEELLNHVYEENAGLYPDDDFRNSSKLYEDPFEDDDDFFDDEQLIQRLSLGYPNVFKSNRMKNANLNKNIPIMSSGEFTRQYRDPITGQIVTETHSYKKVFQDLNANPQSNLEQNSPSVEISDEENQKDDKYNQICIYQCKEKEMQTTKTEPINNQNTNGIEDGLNTHEELVSQTLPAGNAVSLTPQGVMSSSADAVTQSTQGEAESSLFDFDTDDLDEIALQIKFEELIYEGDDEIVNNVCRNVDLLWHEKFIEVRLQTADLLKGLMDYFSKDENLTLQNQLYPNSYYGKVDFKAVMAGDKEAVNKLIEMMSYDLLEKIDLDLYEKYINIIECLVEEYLRNLKKELEEGPSQDEDNYNWTPLKKFLAEMLKKGHSKLTSKTLRDDIFELAFSPEHKYSNYYVYDRIIKEHVSKVVEEYLQENSDALPQNSTDKDSDSLASYEENEQLIENEGYDELQYDDLFVENTQATFFQRSNPDPENPRQNWPQTSEVQSSVDEIDVIEFSEIKPKKKRGRKPKNPASATEESTESVKPKRGRKPKVQPTESNEWVIPENY